ncbi:MAG: hypothetical protein J6I70_05655 [Bacteroidaceae bacterium]|nr:hypothetical protein [Bacteroidaceae bacterium]
MKKFLFATFMGVLVALVGCQQDDELTGVENTLGKKVSVTANIKANAQSRVAMEYVTGADGGSTIKVDWKESGESFLMCDYNDDTKVSTFTQTSGNQFEGTLPSESGTYIAVYGDYSNLVNQVGTLNEDYVWMITEQLTDLTQPIQFEHKTTVLKPTFTLNGKNINATISKIVMGGVFIPGAEAITITPSQVNDIFIFLPAFRGFIEAETPFNFTVTIGDKEYVAELSIYQSMEAGKFYTATIELEEVIPYVTFTADAPQKLMYTGNDLQYSLDGTTFQDLPQNTPKEFSEDGKLYLRNKGEENLDGTNDGEYYFKISFTEEAHVACTGDIRTLIDYDNYENVSTNQAEFRHLFEGCVQLTSAPELPATDLAEYCYFAMFKDCTSLTVAPVLPATTLTNQCYREMFSGCENLSSITMLTTEDVEEYSGRLLSWVYGVAANGTFTKAASVTIPTGISGIPEGWTVVEQ